MDVEYISVHGYIRNTPSDTEVHAEHQLRSRQDYLTSIKERKDPCKTGRTKGLGEKTEVLVGLDLPSEDGGTEAGI